MLLLTQGGVAKWHLDGSAINSGSIGAWVPGEATIDLTAGGYGAYTKYGAVSVVNVAGRGNVVDFAGTMNDGAYLDLGVTPSSWLPTSLSPWSISVWIYLRSFVGNIHCGAATDANNIAMLMRGNAFSSTQWDMFRYNAGVYMGRATVGSPTNLPLSTWLHLLGTADGVSSSGVNMYYNGALSNGATAGNINLTVSGAVHGWINNSIGQPSPPHYFTGQVDVFRMWNRVLTGTEITALYNTPRTGIVFS